jgi:hypothetical protein
MALKVFCVEICFRAVRARIFPIGIFGQGQRVLGRPSAVHGKSWPPRSISQDSSASLRTHHVGWWLYVIPQGRLEYVNTESQVADGLTKALDKRRFEAFRNAIGLKLA